ncbi:hypothetical protein PanWU01x14_141920 [Parasponia andersonii]|uniref:Uncharacterized protein n=1 Tax=Parasponia andersonii TaxID=3476 RepID=A0A2P5CLR5_PARAD|nr:hypothetical protein PanWU01x14_141920 [Parasponia andersonii]
MGSTAQSGSVAAESDSSCNSAADSNTLHHRRRLGRQAAEESSSSYRSWAAEARSSKYRSWAATAAEGSWRRTAEEETEAAEIGLGSHKGFRKRSTLCIRSGTWTSFSGTLSSFRSPSCASKWTGKLREKE